jgi:hypothetical protein
MPTVLTIFGLRVVIYPNDHRPAHVHVQGGGCEAVFNMEITNMEVTNADFEAANKRAMQKKRFFPPAVAVRYDRRIGRVVVSLASGLELAFSPRQTEGLQNAHPVDLTDAQISPSGFGIHFPKLDADIYLPALLEGFLGSEKWMLAKKRPQPLSVA